jgi:hypothetical protein
MMDQTPVRTLFLASEDTFAAWSERHAAIGEVLTIAEADVQRAIDLIARRHPETVVIEQRFLASARGQAFVHRLRHDPDLPPVDLRVLSPEHAASLTAPHSPFAASPAAVFALAQPISGPVRRVVRVQMPEGVQAQVDGAPAELVDLSTRGAQIVSPHTLKPNQRVRVQIEDEAGVYRTVASVAWSTFEIPGGQPQYRAGVEFRNPEEDTLEAFYLRLASSAPTRES